MLYDKNELPEIHYLKHRHDDTDVNFDYEKSILDKSLSPYIFQNEIMSNYLKKMQPAISLLFDHMNVVRNFKNYIVDKYHYKHKG
jgi:hypothetical protein